MNAHKNHEPDKLTLTIPKSKSFPSSKVPTFAAFLFEGLGVACNLAKGLLGLRICEGLFCATTGCEGALGRIEVGELRVVEIV